MLSCLVFYTTSHLVKVLVATFFPSQFTHHEYTLFMSLTGSVSHNTNEWQLTKCPFVSFSSIGYYFFLFNIGSHSNTWSYDRNIYAKQSPFDWQMEYRLLSVSTIARIKKLKSAAYNCSLYCVMIGQDSDICTKKHITFP